MPNYSTATPFSLPPRGSFQVIVELLVTFCLMVLGACGNALVFIAVWKDKSLRTIPNVFVVNLAMTDFLFCVAVLPLTSIAFMKGEWKLGVHGCNLQGLMFGTVLNATLVTMTTISINRFILIRHRTMYRSVYTKTKVKCIVAGIWCYAVVVASRPFYGVGKFAFNSYNAFCSIDKNPKSSSRISLLVAYVALYANIIIIMRCYIGIYRTVRQHRRQINSNQETEHTHGNNSQELRREVGEDINIAKTLFVVICLFGICWFPTAVAGIIVAFGATIPGIVQELLMLSVCLASVANPFVYAVRNRRFRQTLKKITEINFSKIADRPPLRISVRSERVQTTL